MEWKLSRRGIYYFWTAVVIGTIRLMFNLATDFEPAHLFNRWWLSSIEYAFTEFICFVLIGVIAFVWGGWFHPRQAKKRWKEYNP